MNCCHTVAKTSAFRAFPCISLHFGERSEKPCKSRRSGIFRAVQRVNTVCSQNSRQRFESLSLRHFFRPEKVPSIASAKEGFQYRKPVSSSAPLLLDFQHLTVPRGDNYVLRDFSLQIRRGEHVAILGPNGSGKSTLIKAITREIYPVDRPHLRFQLLGQDDWDVNDLRGHFGIVALDQLHNLSNEVTLRRVTARELVLSGYFNSLGLWPHHRVKPAQEEHARSILRFLEIAHLTHRAVSEMSSGEQRRAMIGRALIHDPEALVLDEPTNSLDPGAVREFRDLLRKLARAGRSLLLVTHHIADVIPEIERVILMKGGRIVGDGPKAQMLTSEQLSRLFGTGLKVAKKGRSYDLTS
jgi:iron complex transport system ATP-binding protein